MFCQNDPLSLGTLFRRFPGSIAITWILTLIETGLFACLPLLIGWSIDGLLANDWSAFQFLIAALAVLLTVATARRVYDTRAYGTIRSELGKTQAARISGDPVGVINARVLMGRELVDFLEETAPETMTALVQVTVAILILLSFHPILAFSSGGAALIMLLIYALFAKRFFQRNSALNEVAEQQVTVLQTHNPQAIAAHFAGLRWQEVRLSDMESVVYGLIFLFLLSALAFNLWFAATQLGTSVGGIFSVVSYSLEFMQAAVALPLALQSLTRIREISQRINRPFIEP